MFKRAYRRWLRKQLYGKPAIRPMASASLWHRLMVAHGLILDRPQTGLSE